MKPEATLQDMLRAYAEGKEETMGGSTMLEAANRIDELEAEADDMCDTLAHQSVLIMKLEDFMEGQEKAIRQHAMDVGGTVTQETCATRCVGKLLAFDQKLYKALKALKPEVATCPVEYAKGDDYDRAENPDRDFATFGISRPNHGNIIEVYGDEALRDRILNLLAEEALEQER